VVQKGSTPTVIALGGGTFIQPQNAELLRRRGARMVFLELAIDELLQRCRAVSDRHGENPRPLAADPEAFCALYSQRLPHYRKAELVVSADGKTAEQVAREIAAGLGLAIVNHHSL
jgi:shikimate kinase